MSDIPQFILAVAEHGQYLLTGGVLIAALGLIERKRGRPVPWSAFKWIGMAALLVAFYMAWHDEHKLATKAAEVSTLRSQVVALIRDLRTFQAEKNRTGRRGRTHPASLRCCCRDREAISAAIL